MQAPYALLRQMSHEQTPTLHTAVVGFETFRQSWERLSLARISPAVQTGIQSSRVYMDLMESNAKSDVYILGQCEYKIFAC